MPIRPRGKLLNGGAESGTANWIPTSFGIRTYTQNDTSSVEDANGVASGNVFSAAPYGNLTAFQQVWLTDEQKGQPVELMWQQARHSGTSSVWPGLVRASFYSADGDQVGSALIAPSGVPILGFYQHRKLSGTVPSDADFMLVDMYFENSYDRIDNVTLNLNRRPSAEIGGVEAALEYCPQYVDTISGPADRRWWYSGGLGTKSYVRIDPQNDGWLGEQYKMYCVAAGDKYLVADYNLQSDRAWAGFRYEAYDSNGNLINQQTRLHDNQSWDAPSRMWDVYALPSNTAFLRKVYVDRPKNGTGNPTYDYYANYQRKSWATDINFIMNGQLPTPPADRRILRNGAGDAGVKYWKSIEGTFGVLSVVGRSDLSLGNLLNMTYSSDGVQTTASFDCNPTCSVASANMAFQSNMNGGEFYQDVYVSPYNFGTNAPVRLQWELGGIGGGLSERTKTTSGGATVTERNVIFNGSDSSIGMSLEFYDINGAVLGQRSSTMSFNPFYYFGPDLSRELTANLPANTYRVRVKMIYSKPNKGLIDNITLDIGGQRISIPGE
jgi:hypothetical protein